jgi:putative transposase
VHLVVKLKLLLGDAQAAALLRTMKRFNASCDWLAGRAYADRTANKYLLQRRYYGLLRANFGLGAQMAVRVIAKVCEAYKRDKRVRPRFRLHGAVVYDQRNSRIVGLDRVALSTLLDPDGGRLGRLVVPYAFGAYQRPLLGRLNGQLDLVYDGRTFFVHATVDVPLRDVRPPAGVLGVDLGIVNLAVDSDGTTYAGATCAAVRRRSHRLRRRLQQRGTRAAKRLLTRRRRKEHRYQADVNHVISKRLVQTAASTNRAIALEDLEGIRSRVNAPRGQRRVLHGWAFAQLRSFVEYKAARAGVSVLAVDPRQTSRRCPGCGLVRAANRVTRSFFCCAGCGLTGPADAIAALNIAHRGGLQLGGAHREMLAAGLPVIQPYGSHRPSPSGDVEPSSVS